MALLCLVSLGLDTTMVTLSLLGDRGFPQAWLYTGSDTFRLKAKEGKLTVNGVAKNTFTAAGGLLSLPRLGAKRTYPGSLTFTAKGGLLRVQERLSLSDYLPGVVGAELGQAPLEAAKAQAVLARTWALTNTGRHGGYDFCDGVHCQAYRGEPWTDTAFTEAVRQTEGLVLTYNGRPVETLFHAACGGALAGAEEVWGGGQPYFTVKTDTPCLFDASQEWKVVYSREYVAKLMGGEGCPEVRGTSASGRAVTLTAGSLNAIGGQGIRQTFGLKSRLFAVDCSERSVVFAGRGYGHGVGLCQTGAAHRAARGDGFKAILEFYYPGCEVKGAGEVIRVH